MNGLMKKSDGLVSEKEKGGKPLVPTTQAFAFVRGLGESSKAFAAFQAYVELGPKRTMRQLSRQIGVSVCTVIRWGRKHGWRERLEAREDQLAELQREAIERLAVEKAVEWWKLQEPVRRQAWEEAEEALAMVRKARARWEKSERPPTLVAMARMLELAFRLKQFATGMPSEIKEMHAHVTGTVSMEWKAAIRKAYGQAGGAGLGARGVGQGAEGEAGGVGQEAGADREIHETHEKVVDVEEVPGGKPET